MIIAQPEYAIGTVYKRDPVTGTCDVMLIDEHGHLPNVPVLGTASSDLSNDVETPVGGLLQAKVLLIKLCSKWYILTTIPSEDAGPSGTSESVTNTGTGGDNPLTYKRMNGEAPDATVQQGAPAVKKYTGGRSVDTISGDKVMGSDGGSELLLGKEGLVVLKASTLSQLILGAYKDFARIVSREFELFTDFGTIRCTGGGGNGVTGMAIMGGGNLADEASTIEPAYPVHVFIGEVPWDVNGRFAMQVDSPDGSQHIRTEVDINGNQEMQVSNALVERSKFRMTVADDSEEHHVLGGQYVAVGMGGLNPPDEGDLRDTVKSLDAGDRVTDIKNNDTLNVKDGSYAINVESEDYNVTVEGKQDTEVTGKITEHTKDAKDLKVKGVLKLLIGGLSIGSYDGGSGTVTVTATNKLNIVSG